LANLAVPIIPPIDLRASRPSQEPPPETIWPVLGRPKPIPPPVSHGGPFLVAMALSGLVAVLVGVMT